MPVRRVVAYFCMEYGLDESFPIYSGGLGVLAGDFIKSAHDLELPLVAVGLCWEGGYGVQKIGADGKPTYEYPRIDRSFLEDTTCASGCGFAAARCRARCWSPLGSATFRST